MNCSQKTIACQPSYSTPFAGVTTDLGFTQTPTPITQSPELGELVTDLTTGLTFQSPIVEDVLTTTTESTVLPADIVGSSEEAEIVAVSTAFHPTAFPQLPAVDTILSSSDGVLFYVHSNSILSTCESAFQTFLGSPLDNPKFRDTIILVASTSTELNVILHILYGISPAPYSPSFEIIVNAVDKMPTYSITPCQHIFPGTPLYDLLLCHAPLHPLDVYALAAHHHIHPLAVTTSSHLLSYPLQAITDAQAERMGAVYLRKLMALHVGRFNALKNLLLKPPHPHPPTRQCDFLAQKKLTRAWCLVSAHFAWDARPDMSTHSIQAALDPLLIQLDCEGCRDALRNCIKYVVVRWMAVSRTI